MKKTFYHATAVPNLDTIVKEGLVLSQSDNSNVYGINSGVDNYFGHELPPGYTREGIFLSQTEEDAQFFVGLIEQTHQEQGIKAVVLELELDLDEHEFQSDMEDNKGVIVKNDIAPDAITNIHCFFSEEAVNELFAHLRSILHAPSPTEHYDSYPEDDQESELASRYSTTPSPDPEKNISMDIENSSAGRSTSPTFFSEHHTTQDIIEGHKKLAKEKQQKAGSDEEPPTRSGPKL